MTFLARLASTVGLWAIMLATVFGGYDIGFFCLLAGLALLALREYYRMLKADGIGVFTLTGMTIAVVLLAGGFLIMRTSGPDNAYDFELAVLVLFLFVIFTRQMFRGAGRDPLRAMSYTVFGLLYIPWLFSFITKIIYLTPRAADGATTGQYYVLYLVMVTKFSDMGAYCVGSLIGKHKMIPRVSPGKTWEGFGGAIVVSTGVSLLFAYLAGPRLYGMTWVHAMILGVVLSVAAVVGDLIESIFKREAGLKDSGKFFPGIGGILDLLDSLLFNAPLMYLYLRHVLTHD
ncbi:MAG: CDP-archaeol synthase [Terrimicrobiaceae bacterium]|nr:CDP-archaeol synthase [Terrimicrobiaceae bacterium]